MTKAKVWLVRAILLLWSVQLIWLAWYFAPEVKELAQSVADRRLGEEVRREDPYYRWLQSLAGLIPSGATYIFLDDYEAGKEIIARYHLIPRKHVLLSPNVPPIFLFYKVRQEKAAFVIIRDKERPPGPGLSAALGSPAFQPLDVPGPGLVLQVDYLKVRGEFYD
ncbi:MAG: hypothetical protein FJ126_08240 [Deltaproteobacteria bacterium]|nr:hypothetical protein [Deltaproteobacteria bacterium]